MLSPFLFSYLPKALYRAIVNSIPITWRLVMTYNFAAQFGFKYYYFFS